MKSRAFFFHGAPGIFRDKRGACHGADVFPGRAGFTLLEMCLVIFIIILLAGASLPAIQSAFVEEGLRTDTHQLALMVRTAMIQSSEQHRTYVIDVTSTSVSLHPDSPTPDAPAPTSFTDSTDNSAATTDSEDVTASTQLNSPNKLLAPDPQKAKTWRAQPPDHWLFQPGELCPVPRVRVTRGEAWLEMSFNALTGNVENETAYFP